MSKSTFKSIGAVLSGIITIFALSHVTDLILEKSSLMIIPFNENPLWVKVMVVIYRNLYIVAGAWITASFAPKNAMRHAIILASIGCILGILGAVAMWHEPPHWYPILLIILGWPSAWLGGKLKQTKGDRK